MTSINTSVISPKSIEFINKLKNSKPIYLHKVRDKRNEYLLLYRNEEGVLRCAILPAKGSSSEPCFFGDINYLARTIYCRVYGWKFEKSCFWWDKRSMLRIMKVIDRIIVKSLI